MKRLFALTILNIIKFMLWLRYRVTVKGLDKLTPEALDRPGGVLFLPNHPSVFVDPSLITMYVYPRFPIRPLVVEYMYYTKGVNWLMKFMNAIPIPNLENSSNSLKRRRSERAFQEVVKGLHDKDNFLVYPGARCKRSNFELIGGSSGLYTILQQAPDANVVLVRITGLYGSSFSTALTGGRVPPLFPTLSAGIKIALKNLIFFTPRRDVTIEYIPAPADFPYEGTRMELNRYLEHWYNRPDGIDPKLADKQLPGESLKLVSYSMWRQELPIVLENESKNAPAIDLSRIPPEVQQNVINKLAEMTELDPSKIKPSMQLSVDLGLDSLDAAEITSFLHEHYSISMVPPSELTTVERVMAIATKQVTFKAHEEEEQKDISKFKEKVAKPTRAAILPAKTIPEAFLKRCDLAGNRVVVGDMRSGVLTYKKLKLRLLVLAAYIRKLPGDHVGILLPSSVGATACILAIQLAGKVPVMINWTVGPRHLETVMALSGIKRVLTAWSFIERLDNVELDGIEDNLLFLEEVPRELGLFDKLKALYHSKLATQSLMKVLKIDTITENDRAVLLFTSGTEAMPKGVPLTHRNILSNQRSSLLSIDVYDNDVLFAILPPFHSFGFTISSLMGVLGGLKTAYYPDPTNGPAVAQGMGRWGITILAGAPTFLRGILKAATPDDVKDMRYCVSGAEKAPPELFSLMAKFGMENRLVEGYGITECSPVLTLALPASPTSGVGKPIPGVELMIVHPESLDPIQEGQQGLILANGPNVFSGYLNPGLASPFVDIGGKRWYRTGDLGYIDKDGNLIINGRLKRFVKIGGEMISLSSIESALLEMAGRKGWQLAEDSPSLAVIAQESEGEKTKLCLFTLFPTTLEDINTALREAGFSNLVRMSDLNQLREIPIMGTGKVNYRELQSRYVK